MTERAISDEFWSDPFIRKLPERGRYLYFWFMSNAHLNPSGVFEATLEVISFDTGIPEATLPDVIKSLEKKIGWVPEDDRFWVKNFFKRQCKSPKFATGAVRAMQKVKDAELFEAWMQYNISILHQYNMDIKSIYNEAICHDDLISLRYGKPSNVPREEVPHEG